MTRPIVHVPDPALDLVLERVVDVPRELVWKAWTTPEILMRWFAPLPWTTVACELDLRPGGVFKTVMRSPEGQDFPGVGCCLEVVEHEKFAWTSVLGPGYRPLGPGGSARRRVWFYRRHLPGTPPGRHEVHRPGHPRRPGVPQETRGHGLPWRVGHGARTARRDGQAVVAEATSSSSWSIVSCTPRSMPEAMAPSRTSFDGYSSRAVMRVVPSCSSNVTVTTTGSASLGVAAHRARSTWCTRGACAA